MAWCARFVRVRLVCSAVMAALLHKIEFWEGECGNHVKKYLLEKNSLDKWFFGGVMSYH